MAERVEPFDLGVTWEPNSPEAILLTDDDGRAVLAQRAHIDDSDQRCVVLRWDGALFTQMGPPNDEARHHHPLYDKGLKDVLWAGIVHDSARVSTFREMWSRTVVADEAQRTYAIMPLHYVILSKECVIDVVAENVDVDRIPSSPRQAAIASLG